MRASAGIATFAPTAVMSPSRITTVPRAITLPGPVTMRALRMACTRGVTAAAALAPSTAPTTSDAVRSTRRDRDTRGARRTGTADEDISFTSGRGRGRGSRATQRACARHLDVGNGADRLGAGEAVLQDSSAAPRDPPDRR